MPEPELTLAIHLLKQGKPLPLDLQTKLLSVGVDVGGLERLYGA